MPIVYVDLLFLINGILDGLLLGMTAMLRGYYVPPWRMILGSTVGGLLGVGAYFLSVWIPDGLLAACTCSLLILTAWGWKGKTCFFRDLRLLWGSSMVLSGAVLMLAQWCGMGSAGGGAVYLEISPAVLFGGSGGAYLLLSRLCPRGKFSEHAAAREIFCRMGEREIRFRAMVDTGNLLRDEQGRKVVLLSRSLTAELVGAGELPASADGLYMMLAEKFRPGLLHYRTAGGDGLLVTLRPDILQVDNMERQDYILGIAARELECAPGCRGLIGC